MDCPPRLQHVALLGVIDDGAGERGRVEDDEVRPAAGRQPVPRRQAERARRRVRDHRAGALERPRHAEVRRVRREPGRLEEVGRAERRAAGRGAARAQDHVDAGRQQLAETRHAPARGHGIGAAAGPQRGGGADDDGDPPVGQPGEERRQLVPVDRGDRGRVKHPHAPREAGGVQAGEEAGQRQRIEPDAPGGQRRVHGEVEGCVHVAADPEQRGEAGSVEVVPPDRGAERVGAGLARVPEPRTVRPDGGQVRPRGDLHGHAIGVLGAEAGEHLQRLEAARGRHRQREPQGRGPVADRRVQPRPRVGSEPVEPAAEAERHVAVDEAREQEPPVQEPAQRGARPSRSARPPRSGLRRSRRRGARRSPSAARPAGSARTSRDARSDRDLPPTPPAPLPHRWTAFGLWPGGRGEPEHLIPSRALRLRFPPPVGFSQPSGSGHAAPAFHFEPRLRRGFRGGHRGGLPRPPRESQTRVEDPSSCTSRPVKTPRNAASSRAAPSKSVSLATSHGEWAQRRAM